jgi:hypothetical protein
LAAAVPGKIEEIDRLHVFLDIHAIEDRAGESMAVLEHIVIAAAAAFLAVKSAMADVQITTLTCSSSDGQ